MVRALALFMLVFSLLCLVVHLQAAGGLFGIAALTILAIDLVVARFVPRPGPGPRRADSLAATGKTR